MNAPSVDLRGYLVTGGVCTSGQVFYSHMPDSPDLAVCIYDSGATDSRDAMASLAHPTVQVVVRGAVNGYLAAVAMAHAVTDYLHGINGTSIGGVTYAVSAMGEPAFIGPDKTGRPRIAINFSIEREG